jgi:hypothetical protein
MHPVVGKVLKVETHPAHSQGIHDIIDTADKRGLIFWGDFLTIEIRQTCSGIGNEPLNENYDVMTIE